MYLQYDIVQNQRHQRTAAVSRGSIKTVQHSGRFRIEDGCDEHFERHGCDHPQLYGCGNGIKQAVVCKNTRSFRIGRGSREVRRICAGKICGERDFSSSGRQKGADRRQLGKGSVYLYRSGGNCRALYSPVGER